MDQAIARNPQEKSSATVSKYGSRSDKTSGFGGRYRNNDEDDDFFGESLRPPQALIVAIITVVVIKKKTLNIRVGQLLNVLKTIKLLVLINFLILMVVLIKRAEMHVIELVSFPVLPP